MTHQATRAMFVLRSYSDYFDEYLQYVSLRRTREGADAREEISVRDFSSTNSRREAKKTLPEGLTNVVNRLKTQLSFDKSGNVHCNGVSEPGVGVIFTSLISSKGLNGHGRRSEIKGRTALALPIPTYRPPWAVTMRIWCQFEVQPYTCIIIAISIIPF